ncbi:MAG TPA: polysaccharide pyruvyl transferase family protein [Thermoanaerobaculia bacterium]|nr:polysaccharide pyruvyl transferase family protein [Thermoanaerobaculia bacterium]
MRERPWQIGIVGTFDLDNYGDLLFPLIAEAELRRRLGDVKLHRFSYRARVWPYEVTPVADLPKIAPSLDGLLIGGGFLIRFDKDVAPGYFPPSPDVHHPTGYWLAPALVALQNGVPVIWNAPGTHLAAVPAWARPLLELALAHSRYIAVRDEPSRETLSAFVDAERISVVPDTGFGVARLLGRERSVELEELRRVAGITKPYVIVQAAESMLPVAGLLRALPDHQVVVLPIGLVLDEDPRMFGAGFVHVPFWPNPLLLAELIREAEGVVGHSYHLAITALVTGVPVFTWMDLSLGKFTALRQFETIHPLPTSREAFVAKLGRKTPVQLDVDSHWDRVAEAIVGDHESTAKEALGRFWQSLPSLLEAAAAPAAPRGFFRRWR